MRRRAVLLAVAAVWAGCGAGEPDPASPPPLLTVVQDDAELLHRDDARTAATLDDLRDLGVDWLRLTAGWSVIAPEDGPPADPRDPAAYPAGAWDRVDRAVRLARERGIRVNLDIAFWAPRWAVARPAGNPERSRDGIDAAAFADFAEAVARRYPGAAAFTVWNEPNHPMFWLPQWERRGGDWVPAAPHAYRRMLEAAVPRIRAAAPGALVLVGGLSSLGPDRGRSRGERMAPLTFLRELACVDGALRPLERPECDGFRALPGDGWAHHPYTGGLPAGATGPEAATARMGELGRLTALLGALHAAGRLERALPVYLTEYGFQTDPPDPTAPWSLDEQARMLAEGEAIAHRHPEVRSVSQFLVRDLPPVADAPTEAARWRSWQTGLRFADGRPKPAHAAFALPLVVRPAGEGRVRLWGRVRPGTGRRAARIAVRGPGGAWSTAAEVRTDARGVLEAEVPAPPGAAFRLESGGRTGPPTTTGAD